MARAPGVQSEMELAFAGLHQLCAPMLGHLDGIPGPQQDALRTAFGLAAGPPPDRFFVGLAVLSLLSEVATERPLAGAARARRPDSLTSGFTTGGRPVRGASDAQDLACDAGRGLQEQHAVHDVAELAGPARRDGVDPDALGGVLDGQRSGGGGGDPGLR